MNQLSYQGQGPENTAKDTEYKSTKFLFDYPLIALLVVAFAIDVFTPYFIWKGLLPGAVRFISDLIIAFILVIVVVRMLVFDRIPGAVLLILGITLIWSTVAIFERQSGLATIWGWWLMFRYPLVAIFTFIQPVWPKGFTRLFTRLCLFLLQINTLLQIYQYFTGQRVGDDLAGFFGWQGVIPLLMFMMFTTCLALGYWLHYGQWRMFIWSILLGSIASGLGEIKFFPFAALLVGVLAVLMQVIEGGHLPRLMIFIALFTVLTPAFASFYNIVVADAQGSKRIEEYLDPDTLNEYLYKTYARSGGRFYIGRGFAFNLGWQSIQRDETTFLFGMGIGARSESQALGIVGAGLTQGDYGITAGTSILVFMQEFGIVGLSLFIVIGIWIIVVLWRDVHRYPDSETNPLRFGLIIFTFLWPFWLWYGRIWIFSVVMLLYWFSLGYVLCMARIEAGHFENAFELWGQKSYD